MTATAYPLAWPDGWSRTPSRLQQTGDHFKQGSRMYGERITTVAEINAARDDALKGKAA